MLRLAALLCLAAWPALADRDTALAAVRTDGPTIKDASWMPNGWLYVGVHNDGSDRTGLARYVCGILAEHEVHGAHVKIIDIDLLRRRQQWEGLGDARCR